MNATAGVKTIVLKVGQKFHLKTGRDNIYYAGMISENVYSIVQLKSNGYQGYAWNLFFNRKQTEITIDEVTLYVMRMTPTEIEFSVAG